MDRLDYYVCKFYNNNKKLLYVTTTRDFNKLLKAIKTNYHWANEIEYISRSELLSARMAKDFKNSLILSGNPKYNLSKTLKFTNFKYKEGVLK